MKAIKDLLHILAIAVAAIFMVTTISDLHGSSATTAEPEYIYPATHLSCSDIERLGRDAEAKESFLRDYEGEWVTTDLFCAGSESILLESFVQAGFSETGLSVLTTCGQAISGYVRGFGSRISTIRPEELDQVLPFDLIIRDGVVVLNYYSWMCPSIYQA